MSEAAEETTAIATRAETGVRLSGPRLPYHPQLEERFGIDRGTWKVLTDVLFPSAEAPESIIMAVTYCKARHLDIMKKPVNIVPVYDRKRGKMVDTVWPAISETRITATRTGLYAGKEPTVFGPEITETLGGVEVTYPEWAQVTVYRFVGGQACAFTGEQIRWKEYYAKAKRDTLAPNEMWKTKAYSQASKCAEASALRCAFPEEDSGPTADEMSGQEVDGAAMLSSERVTGPGLMERLPGNQNAEGFDHENGHATTEKARAGVRGKRAARKAAAALPPPDAEAIPTVLDEPEVQEAIQARPTSTEEPMMTAPAQSAEPQPASPASATDASAASPAAVADSSPSNPASLPGDGAEVEFTDTIAAGYPAADEVYMVNGDEWVWNAERGHVRRDTYKNGEPFSDAGRDKGLAIYEDHAPAAPQAEPEAEPVAGEGDGFPPEFDAYIEATEKLETWADIKAALAAFQKTDVWTGFGIDQQNNIRAQTWLTLADDRKVEWLPNHLQDVSAFRLWLEAQDDPADIGAGLHTLTNGEGYSTKPETLRKAIEGAAAGRISLLKA